MSNSFLLVAPMYNASATLPKLLHSLYGQSYEKWRLVLIDDCSSEDELAKVKKTLDSFNTADRCNAEPFKYNPLAQDEDFYIPFRPERSYYGRVTLITNKEKKWEVANVLKGLELAEANDIVCRIDPDDYLCDLDALRIIDGVYDQTGCDALWTMHRWFDDKRVTTFNISAPMAEGADPYKHPWVSSHFKTFRASVMAKVSDKNFRGSDGEYIRRAGDQAVYLPILHQAKKRVFLPHVTYAYRCNMDPETFQTPDAKFQAEEAEFLRKRGFVK